MCDMSLFIFDQCVLIVLSFDIAMLTFLYCSQFLTSFQTLRILTIAIMLC